MLDRSPETEETSADRYLPIIYLRGFTFGRGGTEATVDDPFYGFNTGSTHVRQDVTGRPVFYVFESPVLRLLSDHGYADSFTSGVQAGLDEAGQGELEQEQELVDSQWETASPPTVRPGPEDMADKRRLLFPDQALRRGGPSRDGVDARSLWIYRYYDQASRTYPDSPGRRQEVEESALGLSDLIGHVKRLTGAPRVILIGHSTGGLIIRCLLQRTYPNLGLTPTDHVDKVFTYATPHGGIHFEGDAGIGEWLRDRIGGLWEQSNIDDFGRRRMWEFLNDRVTLQSQPRPPRDWDPRELTNFPVARFFSLVGTNPDDYSTRVSADNVGAHSDGLVQIEHAYVRGGPRAYAHRSHSGRYGIVNSEEGYQNLERFLFGDLRVHLELDRLGALQKLAEQAAGGHADGIFHHLDATVSVRGLPALMHNQQVEHNSAIPVEYRKLVDGQPIPLFTVFLMPANCPEDTTLCRYTLRLRLHPLELRNGRQSFGNHIEQVGMWEGLLDVDTGRSTDGTWTIRWRWRYQMDASWHDASDHARGSGASVEVPFPEPARDVLGEDAVLRMTATPWNDWLTAGRSGSPTTPDT